MEGAAKAATAAVWLWLTWKGGGAQPVGRDRLKMPAVADGNPDMSNAEQVVGSQ